MSQDQFLQMVLHLHRVHECDSRLHHRCDVHGFHHLLGIGAGFQALRSVRVYAVGTLLRMGNGERNERLLALGQRAVDTGHVGVILEEVIRQLFSVLADITEFLQIFGLEIVAHAMLRFNVVSRMSGNITALRGNEVIRANSIGKRAT